MRRVLIVAAGVLLVAGSARAGTAMTAEELLGFCNRVSGDEIYHAMDRAMCVGYIRGVEDAMEQARKVAGKPPCVRAGPSHPDGVILEVRQALLDAPPASLKLVPANVAVVLAVGQSYGCR